MNIFRLYGRVLALLGSESRLAWTLALANVALASAQFAEPVLLGRIIDTLTGAQSRGTPPSWSQLGILLTAWSAAGALGPIVVNYMRDYQLGLGLRHDQVYNQTMYILVGMLAVGLIANLLVKPVDPKWFMSEEELAEERRLAHDRAVAAQAGPGTGAPESGSALGAAIGWIAVGLPLLWGLYMSLVNVQKFFH